MSEKTIALTHNDGDALASLMLIDRVHHPEKWFFTSYTNLNAVMQEIKEYVLRNQVQNVVIADVSFAGRRKMIIDLTRTLAKVSKSYKLIIFDHHTYSDTFWKGVTAEVHVDTSRSACRGILNQYSKTHNLFDLTQFVMDMDAFDIYNTSAERFEEALIFNEFIKVFCNKDSSKLQELSDILIKWNPKYGYTYLMGKFREDYKESFQAYKRDCLDKKVMIRSTKGKKITILMVPEYFNMFVYTEFKRGQDAVVCAANNCIRVRLRKGVFTNEQIKALKAELIPSNPEVGHPCAFPIQLASSKPDIVVETVARVCETINNIKIGE